MFERAVANREDARLSGPLADGSGDAIAREGRFGYAATGVYRYVARRMIPVHPFMRAP